MKANLVTVEIKRDLANIINLVLIRFLLNYKVLLPNKLMKLKKINCPEEVIKSLFWIQD